MMRSERKAELDQLVKIPGGDGLFRLRKIYQQVTDESPQEAEYVLRMIEGILETEFPAV